MSGPARCVTTERDLAPGTRRRPMAKAIKRIPRTATAGKFPIPAIKPAQLKCRVNEDARLVLDEVKRVSKELAKVYAETQAACAKKHGKRHTRASIWGAYFSRRTELENGLREFSHEIAKRISRRPASPD